MTLRQALSQTNNKHANRVVKRIPRGYTLADAETEGIISPQESQYILTAVKHLPQGLRNTIKVNKYESEV